MKTINDFKVGDILIFTQRRSFKGKAITELCAGAVVSIDENDGCVNYTGDYRAANQRGILPTGSGSFDPKKIGVHQFGFIVEVEVIGNKGISSTRPWQPQPGNRGYDLMC